MNVTQFLFLPAKKQLPLGTMGANWVPLELFGCTKSFRAINFSPVMLRGIFSRKIVSTLDGCTHKKIFLKSIIIKSSWNQIVFIIFRLILIQADVRLVLNQSENGKYNLISGWFITISLYIELPDTFTWMRVRSAAAFWVRFFLVRNWLIRCRTIYSILL